MNLKYKLKKQMNKKIWLIKFQRNKILSKLTDQLNLFKKSGKMLKRKEKAVKVKKAKKERKERKSDCQIYYNISIFLPVNFYL